MSRKVGFATLSIAVMVVIGLTAAALVLNVKALAAGSSPAPAQTVAAAGPANTITVVGVGHAGAVPDTATLTLGAAATRGNVHDALNADNGDMSRLLNALHQQGVQDQDIQTTSVYVSQVNNCCPSVVTGYTAANSVTVTIHHLTNVGSVIAAVVDAVGNDVQLNSVNLSVADTGDAVKSARQQAVADASSRAANWASLAGRHAGKLLSLSEVVSTTQGPNCSGGCGAGGAGVPIQAGQSQVTLSITATYELNG